MDQKERDQNERSKKLIHKWKKGNKTREDKESNILPHTKNTRQEKG